MAYDHTQLEVQFTGTAGAVAMSATASGAVSNKHLAGLLPYIIRGFSAQPLTTGGVYTSVVVALNIVDLASGSTASAVATLNFLAADVPGKSIYKNGLNVKVNPGSAVYVNVNTTPTATGTGDFFAAQMWIEPAWELPLNDTADQRVTT